MPEKVEIRRFNATDNREIAPDKRWVIALPYQPEKAVYTDELRRAKSVAPQFPAGAEVLIRYDYGFNYLIFDGADKGDFAKFYDIEIDEQDSSGRWVPRGTHRFVSNFYRLEKNRDSREFFKLPPDAIAPDKVIRFRVFPVESFGKRGEALELVCRIPPDWVCNKSQAQPYPQE